MILHRVKIKQLEKNGIMPFKSTKGSVGYELSSPIGYTILPHTTVLIKTNIAIETPPEIFADIRPKSGITLKTGMRVQYGTIDIDYTGNIGVIIDNIYDEPITVEAGERVAQAVFIHKEEVEFVLTDEFSKTERGENGFGSTGTH